MKSILALLINLYPFLLLAQERCQQFNNNITNQIIYFSHPLESYQVIGKTRLYFYSAPDLHCKHSQLFLIPKDAVIPYFEYNGYYHVSYLKNLDISGWVNKKRLRATDNSISH